MTEKKKIEKLTPEQEAQIQPYLEKTLAEGLSTEPVDRPKVERIVKEVYKERGLKPPKKVYWANGPREASLLHRKIVEEAGEQFERYQIPQMQGQHQLYWLGFYGFLTEVMGLEWDGDLTPHLEMARNCGWWMPFDEFVICCERHNILERDENGNLHCENGPAVAFPDGWELFFWHGTSIPSEWITDKENVDPALALTWDNIEQRRCLAEILGWDKVLEQLNPKIIDEDSNPEIGTLMEVELPDSGTERFLRVKCGTGRDFVIPVDPSLKTALQANAWTYGLEDSYEDFLPEVRT